MTSSQVPSQRYRSVVISLLSQLLFLLPWTVPMFGQSAAVSTTSTSVPHLMKFSGTVRDMQGTPRSGVAGITIALYKDEQGGAPLWLETQNVQLDNTGHYTVYLGATKSDGLPQELFVTGEARWLGVQAEGQAEQPRTLLLSVPYALKAGDAETVGGLPPSAFVLAAPATAGAGTGTGDSHGVNATAVISGSGSPNFVPLWTAPSILGNSVLFQSGSGGTASLGVNTTTPAATLDVNGSQITRGALQLPSTGTATAGSGFSSQPFSLQASAFNSGTGQAVGPVFQWQSEPSGNNTSNPAGTLNLLYGNGSGSPSETGLNIASNGKISFASGQTFPGTGTITGVTTAGGSGLSGGGTSGTLNLSLTNTCAANQVLQWNGSAWACATLSSGGTITGVTAGIDLTGGGSSGNVTLNVDITKVVTGVVAGTDLTGGGNGGVQTLNLDTTKVPQLNAANTFTGNQTVNGNLTATGGVSASGYSINGNLLAYGSLATDNVFIGFFAGNSSVQGVSNTAIGDDALLRDTTGHANTAGGAGALTLNTTGSVNTAYGLNALDNNTGGSDNVAIGNASLSANITGNNNTAVGVVAGNAGSQNNTTTIGFQAGAQGNNAAAIGSNALATIDNALVLGSINGVNGATADTFVGIGTTAPAAKLDVHGTANFTGPVTFASGQTFPNTISGVTAGTDLTGGGSTGNVTLNVDTTKVVTGVIAGTDLTGGGTGGVQTLSLDTTKVPQLAAANTFTNNQTVNGALTATGTVSGSGFSIGGNLFAFGGYLSQNAFLGFGGSTLTTGSSNVAIGFGALNQTTLGTFNTAVGAESLQLNVTGSGNTALGPLAGPDAAHPDLTNSTAIGGRAQVTASNAMVLGSINGVNGANADTWVGIGTTAPASTLDVEATAPGLVGPAFLLKNKAPVQAGLGNSVDLRFALDGGSSVGNPNAFIRVAEDGNNQYGAWISFATMADGGAGQGAQERMRIRSDGFVGIGTAIPDALLSVNGGADKVGGGSWGTFSDGRLKTLDGDFQSGLNQVLKLHPVRYRYKEGNGMGINDRDQHIGFVAQDVQKVIPEAVTENKMGYLLVNNDPILWTMLNAIKEQQQQIQKQQKQIDAQRAEMQRALRRVKTQQQQIAGLNGKVVRLESTLRAANLRDHMASAAHVSSDKPAVTVANARLTRQPGN